MPNAALAGIRILDFSHVYQGPVGTQLLADFGADVIKVERPGGGDWSRQWGPFVNGVSLPYACLNRNKRSIAPNLKSAEGLDIVLRLVKRADVLVENYRPGTMDKLGLGYDQLRPHNRRLIYARSTGWGDQGPYVERGRPGHDMLARAAAGWFEPLGPDGLPVPSGISADYPAGLMLMVGILIALLARERTGEGQLVSTDLLSTAFHAHSWDGASILNRTRVTDAGGIGVTEGVIRKSFRTRDGFIELSPVFSPNALRDISVALGLGDLSVDPRFGDPDDRRQRADELNALLEERFMQRDTAEWVATLEPQGVLCGEIRTFEQAAHDPQVLANGMVVEMSHPRAGPLTLLGTPVRLSATPATLRTPPPDLGEQADDILREVGYTMQEVAGLRERGVV